MNVIIIENHEAMMTKPTGRMTGILQHTNHLSFSGALCVDLLNEHDDVLPNRTPRFCQHIGFEAIH